MSSDETKKFFEMLYHDDRNSNIFICHYDNRMHSNRMRVSEINLDALPQVDCYASINGFVGRTRECARCRQINAIFIDLDCHNEIDAARIKWCKGHSYMLICDAIAEGRLPQPNLIVDTGCGLHLYYILENSISCRCRDGSENTRAIYAFKMIQRRIQEKLKTVLDAEPDTLTIDHSAYDLSRIARIPGTYNRKTGKMARILYCCEDYMRFEDHLTPAAEKSKSTTNDKNDEKRYDRKHKSSAESLQLLRVKEMERLQELRGYDCEGTRELMAFCYYNAAVQIYGKSEAEKMLWSFCDRFAPGNSPLRECEIAATMRGVDNAQMGDVRGHYVLTRDWIIDRLQITDSEANAIGMFSVTTKRQIKKCQNQQTKSDRNAQIIRMARDGMRHADIAAALKISLRTVQNVLKENSQTRSYNVQKKAT